MSKRRRRANWQAAAVGLAATAAVLVAYAAGGLDWIELKTLDLRFLYANSIPESDQLVCIDIDDASVEKIGRWPWPRDVQAGVIALLPELGAKALLLDITLGEPEPVRTIVPRQVDIAVDPLKLRLEDLALAFPDFEIRAAIADAGAVYLAFDYLVHDVLRCGELWRVVEALQRGNEAEAQRLAAALPRRPAPPGGTWAPLQWARMLAALAAQPTLTAEQLAGQLAGANAKPIAGLLEPCRQVALYRATCAWLAAKPERWNAYSWDLFDPLYADLIGATPAFREAVGLALRDVLGEEATTRVPLVPPDGMAPAAPAVDAISPVYYLHARAAKRCGFVVVEPDMVDGVVRHLPLMVRHDGHVLPQLAFGVAFDQLGLGPADVQAVPGHLLLRRHDGGETLAIQLDAAGRVLVPWVGQADWTRQFGEHIPIDAVWQVFDRRGLRGKNDEFLAETLAGLHAQGHLAGNEQYVDDLKQVLRLQSDLRRARYAGDRAHVDTINAGLAEYQQLLADGARRLRAAVAAELQRVTALPENELGNENAAYAKALRAVESAFAANEQYTAEIDATLRWLRARVKDKICVIGYTATSLADMPPIPTKKRAPGVVAHANLLSGLLTGRMASWTPAWLNAVVAAALGVLATIVSVRWGPRTVGVVAVAAIAYLGLAGWLAFYAWTYWIGVTPAIAALVVSYTAVAVHRYAFVDRQRRQLTTTFSQYTSATLARQMAEDAELCRRAETREVTTMFTDLAGFTSISERIGAERTQRVLNTSLGRFADVMLRYEGMINKFIGDGIFAFWNPVIYPQADHARRACATAIELQTALRELIAAQRRTGGDEAFGELVLRIGAATGNAVVGPCGSEQKYDYTCIGDSVNVASRLESANKFYGTRILVSGATREQAGAGFVFRPLGGVQVKGKTQAVPIFELLGRDGDVAAEVLHCAERFAAGVAAFQRRDWPRALDAFEACLAQHPDDRAAREYVTAVRRFTTTPPAADWNAALELSEK